MKTEQNIICGRYMTMLLTILATVGWHLTNLLFWYKHPVEQKLFEMVRQMKMMTMIAP